MEVVHTGNRPVEQESTGTAAVVVQAVACVAVVGTAVERTVPEVVQIARSFVAALGCFCSQLVANADAAEPLSSL